MCVVAAQLDYYDVSLEILAVYLQSFPSSAVAVNLKACNHFRLYNGACRRICFFRCARVQALWHT